MEKGEHMKTVIFACIHNAGRSQMAAALFNNLVDSKKARAVSAGTHPADQVHPNAIVVMKEIGVDISNEKPKLISIEMLQRAEILVTMGCEEWCPSLPTVEHIKWDVTDTYMDSLEEARRIRDQLKLLVQFLINELH